ncbi:hypothetical protein Taro_022981, partial [Colocasia esculenta]|nr:hypothetical protein [Colocasia esculenta]
RLYIDVAQTIFYLALRVVTFHRLLRSLFGRKVQAPCQPIKTRGSRARRQLSWRVLHPTKGRLQRCHRRSYGKSLHKRLAKRSSVVFGSFSPSSTRSLPPSTFDCLGGCFYVSNHLGGGHGGQDSPGRSGNLFGRPRRRGRLFMAPAAGTTSCSVERIVVGTVATTSLATTPAGAETSVASATFSRRTGDTAPSLLLLEEAPAVLLAAPCSAPPTWEALEGSLSFEQVEPLASSMAGLPDPSLTTTSPSSAAIPCATSGRSVEAARDTPWSADFAALLFLRSSDCALSSSSSVPSSSCGGVAWTAFCFFRARSCSASSALSSTRTGLFFAEGRLARTLFRSLGLGRAPPSWRGSNERRCHRSANPHCGRNPGNGGSIIAFEHHGSVRQTRHSPLDPFRPPALRPLRTKKTRRRKVSRGSPNLRVKRPRGYVLTPRFAEPVLNEHELGHVSFSVPNACSEKLVRRPCLILDQTRKAVLPRRTHNSGESPLSTTPVAHEEQPVHPTLVVGVLVGQANMHPVRSVLGVVDVCSRRPRSRQLEVCSEDVRRAPDLFQFADNTEDTYVSPGVGRQLYRRNAPSIQERLRHLRQRQPEACLQVINGEDQAAWFVHQDGVALLGVDDLLLLPDPETLAEPAVVAASNSTRRRDGHPARSGDGLPFACHCWKDRRGQRRHKGTKEEMETGEGKKARKLKAGRFLGGVAPALVSSPPYKERGGNEIRGGPQNAAPSRF